MNLPFISDPYQVSNEDYHHSKKYKDFLSSTQLKLMMTSPKWYKYCKDHPEEQKTTHTMDLGSLYHDMLGSVALGDESYFKSLWQTFTPPVNPKTLKPFGADTRAYNEAYEDAIASAQGRQLTTEDNIKLCESMINELLEGNPHLSKDIRFLIKSGQPEQSHFCKYQDFGFKYRTDLKTTSKIIDWKSCAKDTAHPDQVHRQIIRFNYHISGAFYQFFDFQCTGRWRHFYWIFQETEPPFDFIIESADNWCFEITKDDTGRQLALPKCGAVIMLKLLEQYMNCMTEDVWPGYSIFIPEGFRKQRINYSKVPAYYEKIMFNFYN